MSSATGRSIGLFGATLVGLGAIVGGGIFALGGVAFAITGPSVILAFAINGVIALLTVLSFAEMATAFPENGGTYSFARKVFQVEAAFLVGWVVWFASIVAAALYALGFASYAIVVLRAVAGGAPAWLAGAGAAKLLGAAATAFYSFRLARKAAGGGRFEMLAKMALFGVLIAAGAAALFGRPAAEVAAGFRPFFTAGSSGLLLATGLTFIALQGFDLIAAAAGEVRDPRRNIPRAMLLSLALALAIYLPLLFLVVAVGTPPGVGVAESASGNPETLIADAARVFLGDAGYWLVVVVALLAMLSALQANLFAASRVARAMALDKTLPAFLASVDARRGTPKRAVAAGALSGAAILAVTPDLAAAGAVASLIFLVSFALTHWISILARLRTGRRTSGFRSPLFPLVPVAGGL
ncbi:MAG TPA: APC family permease, partial [Planctomycetota bacterium]